MKAQLLLAGTGDPAGLEEAVRAEVGRWRVSGTAVPGLRIRWGIRLPEDPFAATEHGASTGSFAIDSFAEIATTVDDPALLTSIVAGAADRLGGTIDPGRSAAVMGTEHVIFAGDRGTLLVYALRRLPTLTHEQFCDHWLHRHAEFARATQAERGYRQFHADLSLSAGLAAAAGLGIADIDGVAEASYRDVADFFDVMSRPEVAGAAMKDEKLFIDHSRSAGAVVAVSG